MPKIVPNVTRLDFTDEELAVYGLTLNHVQAHLNADIGDIIRTTRVLKKVWDKRPDVLTAMGKKLETVLGQDKYDESLAGILDIPKCPDCGGYHD